MAEGRCGLLADRVPLGRIDLLAQHPDPHAARHAAATAVLGLVAGGDAEQRGLARAIRSHQADPIADVHGEIDAGEENAIPEALRDSLEPEQHEERI